jgi:hypothetical protein
MEIVEGSQSGHDAKTKPAVSIQQALAATAEFSKYLIAALSFPVIRTGTGE